MDYLLHILIMAGIFGILATSLNLLLGYTGLLSVAHAGIAGVGAYTAALLGLRCGFSFVPSLLLSVLVCATFGALVGLPALRLRDEAFVIASFSFQVLVVAVANNLDNFTGGPMGLPGIPAVKILGFSASTPRSFMVLLALVCAALFFLVRILVLSPYGRQLRAIREDELFAMSAGKNTPKSKLIAFSLSAGIAGCAGALFAYYISFIDPTSFSIMESILVVAMVVIGGAGNLWGPILGAVVLVALPEMLRFVGLPQSVAPNVRQMLYGLALVACMLCRPQGLIGEYAFGREAKRK
jgi:branched-chain amino acid transport system permease protein